jgi:plastocyanin
MMQPIAIGTCLALSTGISDPCGLCWGEYSVCTITLCQVCMFAPQGLECQECTAANCDPPMEECSGLVMGTPEAKLIINEIDPDNKGADTAEFVELYNPGDDPVDMEGVFLVLVNGASNEIYHTQDLSDFGTVSPGEYVLIIKDGYTGLQIPDGVNVQVLGENLQNGPDAIALVKGDPAGDPVAWDTVSYGGVVDLAADWWVGEGATPADSPAGTLSRCPNGEDSDDNGVDFSAKEPTPGLANLCQNGPPAQDQLCQKTGGKWMPFSCGHWTCGQEPMCDAIIPGCYCGDGMSFDADTGCFQDDACANQGDVHFVNIDDFYFDGDFITIQAGDTVEWTNVGNAPHTVEDGVMLDSGTISPGSSWTFQFNAAGSYDYFCGFHGGMTGTIQVDP